MIRALTLMTLFAGSAAADTVNDLETAAHRHFTDLPKVQRVDQIAGHCGATPSVNTAVVYCTSQNMIYLTHSAAKRPEAAYLVAHVYGHAIQVRHGVADVALSTIRARRSDETALRMDVTRMVECIAGVLVARADLPPAQLADWFRSEPFSGSHWGRDPLRIGPQVTMGLAERDAWFQKGQIAAFPDVCTTAEFPADLVVTAFRE